MNKAKNKSIGMTLNSNKSDERWYFTAEQLENSPSRVSGISAFKESELKQLAAELIQTLGEALGVPQLCTNTAMVFMHRFYMFHSLSMFHPCCVVPAAMLLAVKVELMEFVQWDIVNMLWILRGQDPLEANCDDLCRDMMFAESVLLQTLAFNVTIDHSQTYINKACKQLKVSKGFSKLAGFACTASLYLTTMCLKYKPAVVACFCIYFASLRFTKQIRHRDNWYQQIDRTVTLDLLMEMSLEFMKSVITMRPYRGMKYRSETGREGGTPETSTTPLYLHHDPSDFSSILLLFQSGIIGKGISSGSHTRTISIERKNVGKKNERTRFVYTDSQESVSEQSSKARPVPPQIRAIENLDTEGPEGPKQFEIVDFQDFVREHPNLESLGPNTIIALLVEDG